MMKLSGLVVLAALIALASACAVTGASRKSPDGHSEWSSSGVAVFETPAEGYAKTAAADATLLFAQTVAAQRSAIVQAAYEATKVDPVAREEIMETKKIVLKIVEGIGAAAPASGADDGGAR